MAIGLFIEIAGFCPFAPEISDCLVLVYLDEAFARGAIEITMPPALTDIQIASVLSALQLFFQSEQFKSIDFDNGEMMVEHRGRADEVTFVPANEGNLREDGVVEFAYDVPHK
ncbi:MAG: hypothetical protein MUF23_11955 [Pirellula sp.]|nr:hypothetical protein [Pirellula sp.]